MCTNYYMMLISERSTGKHHGYRIQSPKYAMHFSFRYHKANSQRQPPPVMIRKALVVSVVWRNELDLLEFDLVRLAVAGRKDIRGCLVCKFKVLLHRGSVLDLPKNDRKGD